MKFSLALALLGVTQGVKLKAKSATTLNATQDAENMRCEDTGATRTYEAAEEYAKMNGGRLLTKEELIMYLGGKNQTSGDMWAAVQDTDGTKDWIQIGDIHVHFPGKSHNEVYGYPTAWADTDAVVEHVKHWVCLADVPKPYQFNPHSAISIMKQFDENGDGTIHKKEFRRILTEMCGGESDCNECFTRGIEHFFDARGEVRDGVQLDEVVAFLNRERDRHVARIMKAFDEFHGGQMTARDNVKMQFETRIMTITTEFEVWMHKFDEEHRQFWFDMAQSVIRHICQDEECEQLATEGFEAQFSENAWIDRDVVHNFILFVESLANKDGPEDAVVMIQCAQDPAYQGHSWTEQDQNAEMEKGRLPTTSEMIQFIGDKPFEDGRDIWVATQDPDGKPNYVQLGNNPWYPGMDHNAQGWGRGWEFDSSGGPMTSVFCVAW